MRANERDDADRCSGRIVARSEASTTSHKLSPCCLKWSSHKHPQLRRRRKKTLKQIGYLPSSDRSHQDLSMRLTMNLVVKRASKLIVSHRSRRLLTLQTLKRIKNIY